MVVKAVFCRERFASNNHPPLIPRHSSPQMVEMSPLEMEIQDLHGHSMPDLNFLEMLHKESYQTSRTLL